MNPDLTPKTIYGVKVMAKNKPKKPNIGKKGEYYSEPNHDYFSEHFEELVLNHGGKWIVLIKGELISICHEDEITKYLALAREKYPGEVPFASPIPKKEEIECIL